MKRLTVTFTGPSKDRIKFEALKDILSCNRTFKLENKTNDLFEITSPYTHHTKPDMEERYLKMLGDQIYCLVHVDIKII